MKTLNFKSFEKININPINITALNNIDDSLSTITKSSLKTFDIVKIYDKKYMVFKNDDAKKYFEFFRLASNDLYKNVFIRINTTNRHTTPNIQLFNNFLEDLKYWSNHFSKLTIKEVWLFKDTDFNEYDSTIQMIDLTQAAIDSYIKKYNYVYFKTNTEINEKAIKTGGAKITNDIDDASKYDTVKQIVDDTQTHYVSTYNNSDKLLDVLTECGLLEKGNGSGGTLYKNGWNGVLYYWLKFKDMSTLCRFLVEFNDIYEIFSYDYPKDGKWRMCFDIHDDPLTGTEDCSVTYLLRYFSKTSKLDEIDKAVETLCYDLLKKYYKQ